MNIYKKIRGLVKEALLRVAVSVLTALTLAVTYPLSQAFEISHRTYVVSISVVSFVIIWVILDKIEN